MISNAVPYTVPHEPGRWQSVILAVTVHALLFTFLGLGINWANDKPETIDVEAWSPQELEKAPPVVQPPPPPVVEKPEPEVVKPQEVKPDIEEEQDKRRKKHEKEIADQKAAKEKAEKADLAAQQAEKDKKKLHDEKEKRELAAKEAKVIAAQRQADRDRMTKEVSSTGTNGTAAQSQGNKGDPSYAARIRALIKSNTHVLVSSETNAPVQFEVKLLPGGQILSIKKTGSSGYPEFDEAVERAINLSAPFPPDSTGMVPKVLPINYRPNDQKS